MIKGLTNFFTTPSLARTLVIIAIIILVFLLISWYRSSRKRRQQEKQFNDDYKTLTQQGGQKASFLATNYTQFADRIYEAGCIGAFCYGTDEEAIFKVFEQMVNELDVLLLVKAFGLREERGTFCLPGMDCGLGLGAWLQTELGEDDFTEINKILSQKEIKYQF